MGMIEKTLWVVNYSSLQQFHDMALNASVMGVAIRTDNNVGQAIDLFHASGIQVFGWRWPSAQRTDAIAEANNAAALFEAGMDGYFVDPEGEQGKPYDWDKPGLEDLATEFCAVVANAAGDRPFGVTSHYRGRFQHPNLPWAQFFERATVLLPQAYWRVEGGKVGSGSPQENYLEAVDCWVASGGNRSLIVPMAGELAQVTSKELDAYVALAAELGVLRAHFYTFDPAIGDDVWASIAAA